MARSDGLRLAVTTLTVLPLPGPATIDRRTGRTAMLLAPLVGGLLAVPVAAVLLVARLLDGVEAGLLPPVLAVVALVVLTRGLHLDGLADTVDGLASYRPAADALAVMRGGDTGPLGVAAVVLVLLVQTAALGTAVAGHHGTVTVLVALLSGRLALTVGCRAGTPVAAGSRLGAVVVGTVPALGAAAVVVATCLVAVVAAGLDVHTADRGLEAGQAALAPLLAVAAAEVLRRHAIRRLGGLTGDVLGALVEVATTVALLVMAAGGPALP